MDLHQKQALFSREYPMVFEYLYRFISVRVFDRDEANDVVSEIFTKAYTLLDRFEPEKGNLRQWLTGFAKYELLTHWRRKKPNVSLELDETLVDPQTGTLFVEQLDNHLLAEKIYERLPKDQKRLLTLRYVDGLTYEELAEVTGREPAALRQLFSRLHRVLRLEFQEVHD